MGRCPLPTTISVSSSAMSATATPSTRSTNGLASRADLEHRAQGTASGDGVDPTAHRPIRTECPDARLGELLGGPEVSGMPSLGPLCRLERDFVVAPMPPRADDEAGPGHPPIGCVDVGIDQTLRRAGGCSEQSSGRRARWTAWADRGQPALNRAQIECVELPLDPDVVLFVTHPARVVPVYPKNGNTRFGVAHDVGCLQWETERQLWNSTTPPRLSRPRAACSSVGRTGSSGSPWCTARSIRTGRTQRESSKKAKPSKKAAQREVFEETGFACRLLRFIGHTEYVDRKGRPKVVAYWVMLAESGSFVPNEEVDELRWVDVVTAGFLLTYDRDRALLAAMSVDDQLESLV